MLCVDQQHKLLGKLALMCGVCWDATLDAIMGRFRAGGVEGMIGWSGDSNMHDDSVEQHYTTVGCSGTNKNIPLISATFFFFFVATFSEPPPQSPPLRLEGDFYIDNIVYVQITW